jgi:hypothetical protein
VLSRVRQGDDGIASSGRRRCGWEPIVRALATMNDGTVVIDDDADRVEVDLIAGESLGGCGALGTKRALALGHLSARATIGGTGQ